MKLPTLPTVPDFYQVVGYRTYPRDWVTPSFAELDRAEAHYTHMVASGDYEHVELLEVKDGDYRALRPEESCSPVSVEG